MDMLNFEQQRKKKERLWDTSWLSLMMVFCIVVAWSAWTYAQGEMFDKTFTSFFATLAAWGGSLALIKPIDKHLRRNALKKYWIEDHGDVIKLFGSVPANDIGYVYRQVLKVRPGYKIVDDAYKKFGCTIAAVRASQSELDAKKQLTSMGIKVDRIG